MICRTRRANLEEMTTPTRSRFTALLVAALAVTLVAAGCGGGGDSGPSPLSAAVSDDTNAETSPGTSAAEGATSTDAADPIVASDFPYATGPAVTVPAGYEAPTDRVDSTGAFLPANGKPTLVFVDAIW